MELRAWGSFGGKAGPGRAKVVIADLNYEAAKAVAERLGENAAAVKVDVTDYTQCEQMAKAALDRWGRIDLLVANAILIAKPTEEFAPEQWRKVIEVNLVGYFNAAKAVIPAMLAQGKGILSRSTASRERKDRRKTRPTQRQNSAA